MSATMGARHALPPPARRDDLRQGSASRWCSPRGATSATDEVPPEGLQPSTSRLKADCSKQLSYGGAKRLAAFLVAADAESCADGSWHSAPRRQRSHQSEWRALRRLAPVLGRRSASAQRGRTPVGVRPFSRSLRIATPRARQTCSRGCAPGPEATGHAEPVRLDLPGASRRAGPSGGDDSSRTPPRIARSPGAAPRC